ncbi:hypothetical protein JOS77_24705 [Chromobacterium haemolyticum]|nr:hypothetical protein JOS77_24705 [Chromobacterium haemolyticum]
MREQLVFFQPGDELARGAHRSNCVGAGWADAYLEQIKNTDGHNASL